MVRVVGINARFKVKVEFITFVADNALEAGL